MIRARNFRNEYIAIDFGDLDLQLEMSSARELYIELGGALDMDTGSWIYRYILNRRLPILFLTTIARILDACSKGLLERAQRKEAKREDAKGKKV